MTGLITAATMREHRATWFVYAGGYGQPTERVRKSSGMRGSWAGWDVECSCGKASRTGGAIKARVAEWLFDHRFDAQVNAELRAEASAAGYDPDDMASYRDFLLVKIGEVS